MVRGDDNNSITGCNRWWLLVQTLVWIILRIEMPPRDAEQLVNSPEMHFKIEQALNELEKKLCEAAALGMVRGIARIPYDPAALYPGLQAPYPGLQRMRMAQRRYVDLFTLYQPPPEAEPDAQSAALHEFLELIRRPDVEFNSTWLGHVFPAPALAVDAAAPVANTEAPVAKLEPAARAEESMPQPASPVESELAPPTEPPRVEPALVSSAPEVESRTPLPTTPPDESTLDQVESDAPDNSARRPSDTKLKAFVKTYIENAKASGKVPTKQGLWGAARNTLPGATRKRLHDEYENQTPTLPPGRPRKVHE